MPEASVSCSLSILHFWNLIGPMQCIFSSNGFLVVGGKTGSCLSPRAAFATSKALHFSRWIKIVLNFGPRSQQQPLFCMLCLLLSKCTSHLGAYSSTPWPGYIGIQPCKHSYAYGLVSARLQGPPKMGHQTAEAKPFEGHLQPQALRLLLPFVNTLMEKKTDPHLSYWVYFLNLKEKQLFFFFWFFLQILQNCVMTSSRILGCFILNCENWIFFDL